MAMVRNDLLRLCVCFVDRCFVLSVLLRYTDSDCPFGIFRLFLCEFDCFGGIMVSVLTSSAVDRGFKPWSGQTKDYEIGICCFSAKHAALKRKQRVLVGSEQSWGNRNQL